jgi:hypothetical protein
MKIRALTLVMSLVVSACAAQIGQKAVPSNSPFPAALVELITNDHTFGSGPSPFTVHLVLDHLDPAAGMAETSGLSRPLTDEEQEQIAEAFQGIGEMRWIQESSNWISEDLMPMLDSSVILGVGEPRIEGTTAFVPVSLWCGGTCGTWLTYRLDLVAGSWEVVGIDGPVAVS